MLTLCTLNQNKMRSMISTVQINSNHQIIFPSFKSSDHQWVPPLNTHTVTHIYIHMHTYIYTHTVPSVISHTHTESRLSSLHRLSLTKTAFFLFTKTAFPSNTIHRFRYFIISDRFFTSVFRQIYCIHSCSFIIFVLY